MTSIKSIVEEKIEEFAFSVKEDVLQRLESPEWFDHPDQYMSAWRFELEYRNGCSPCEDTDNVVEDASLTIMSHLFHLRQTGRYPKE